MVYQVVQVFQMIFGIYGRPLLDSWKTYIYLLSRDYDTFIV